MHALVSWHLFGSPLRKCKNTIVKTDTSLENGSKYSVVNFREVSKFLSGSYNCELIGHFPMQNPHIRIFPLFHLEFDTEQSAYAVCCRFCFLHVPHLIINVHLCNDKILH